MNIIKQLNEALENRYLNENILNEKLWVELIPQDNKGNNIGSGEYNVWYLKNNKDNELDVTNELLPVIKDEHQGTFKQSLDKELRAMLKKLVSSHKLTNFKFGKILNDSNEIFKNNLKRLTLTDRDLRKKKAEIINKGVLPGGKEGYTHHIDGHEDNNDPKNLMLFEYNGTDLSKILCDIQHLLAHGHKNFT